MSNVDGTTHFLTTYSIQHSGNNSFLVILGVFKI